MRTLILALSIVILSAGPVFSSDYRTEWDKYLWGPCYAPDREGAEKCVERIMSNYKGPSLPSISETCQLAEFVRKPNGDISWIYHPDRWSSLKLISPEIRSALDEAIRKSGPFPSLGFIPECTFALMYSPERAQPVWLGGSDRPSPVGALVSNDGLRQWDADAWAQANHKEVLKHFTYPQGVSKSIRRLIGSG